MAVLATAAAATGVAALGPLYARSANESTLNDQLTGATADQSGLHFQAGSLGADRSTVDENVAAAPKVGTIPGFPTRIVGAYVPTTASVIGRATVRSGVLWRQGACGHLVILSGHCPTKARQVLIAARTAAARTYGWQVGATVRTGFASMKIVGTYRPKNTADPFWFGNNYFSARLGSGRAGQQGLDQVDTMLVAQSEFNAIGPGPQVEIDIDYPIAPDGLRLDNVARVRADITRLRRDNPSETSLTFRTGLPGVLDAAGHQSHLADAGVLLVTLQLSLLAWVVLFHVVGDAASARGNEIALAKLRGFRPSWTLRFGIGELMLLLVFAVPFGMLLAWGVTRIIASAVLASGTPVVFTWPAALAMASGFAGGVVAAALAAYRTLTRPVLEQWRRTTARQRAGRFSWVIDLVVAGLAVGGLVVLQRRHQTPNGDGSIALLAPGLLVTAVALLGTRLLPIVARPVLPATRGTRRIGTFLAARQVVRRPAGLRLAAVLAVALGLATFAVGGEATAAGNRTARAHAELGAAQVVSIQYQDSAHDPVAQVRKADPDGRWAMATASWLPDGGGSVLGTVLAVDSARLATVGYPASGGPSTSAIAGITGAAEVPTVTVTASAIRARITASGMTGHPAQIEFDLRSTTNPFVTARAEVLRPGTHEYVATVPCHDGCTFQGLSYDRAGTYLGAMSGTTVISALAERRGATWAPLDTHLTKHRAWRAGTQYGHSTTKVTETAAGLRSSYRADNGGYGGISYAYTADPVPALSSPGGVSLSPDLPRPLTMLDGLGTPVAYVIAQQVRVLPSVLADGLIVDLGFMRAHLPDFDNEAIWHVWLGAHAPRDAIARLKAAGLIVQSVATVHARVTVLARQGPALALLLLLACAIAGAVLAVGATTISISASARRRSFETAALRAVGVPRSGLYRAGVLEQLMLLGAAVVLGVPAGFFGARLAVPAVPEFADPTPILMHYTPPVRPVVLIGAGFCVLIVLAALVAAQGVIRAARPSRLREAEE